jgi:hypothetical protein
LLVVGSLVLDWIDRRAAADPDDAGRVHGSPDSSEFAWKQFGLPQYNWKQSGYDLNFPLKPKTPASILPDLSLSFQVFDLRSHKKKV